MDFEQARDSMFGDFFTSREHIEAYAASMGEEYFAHLAVNTLNQRLPEGFKIILHPHGSDFETVINDSQN
jgi:hypothetical protein